MTRLEIFEEIQKLYNGLEEEQATYEKDGKKESINFLHGFNDFEDLEHFSNKHCLKMEIFKSEHFKGDNFHTWERTGVVVTEPLKSIPPADNRFFYECKDLDDATHEIITWAAREGFTELSRFDAIYNFCKRLQKEEAFGKGETVDGDESVVVEIKKESGGWDFEFNYYKINEDATKLTIPQIGYDDRLTTYVIGLV